MEREIKNAAGEVVGVMEMKEDGNWVNVSEAVNLKINKNYQIYDPGLEVWNTDWKYLGKSLDGIYIFVLDEIGTKIYQTFKDNEIKKYVK